MPEIKIPYNWVPSKHQLEVLKHPARYKVIVWHRKAWKTTLAINELIRHCYAVKGTYWYVAPYYGQAKKIVWDEPEMLAKYVPPDVWNKRNSSELKLQFPNGSVFFVLGADKPDSLRGPNPRGVVLDEYGDMKEEIWSAIIQPIMIARQDGFVLFTGTPKGANDFKRKFDYAKTTDDPKWAAFFLDAVTSGIISPESLEEAKRSTTQAFFGQEYLCEFLESASQVFRRIRENVIPDTENQFVPSHQFQLGVDLAKSVDWSVITPYDLNTTKVLHQDRFNQVDWNLQKARIESAYYKHNSPQAYIDSTGVGDPIVEDLSNKLGSVEGYKFTEQSRRDLLTNLAIKLEQGRIKLPNDEGLINELQSFRYELLDKGKTRMSAPEGCSDDRVFSLALAVWNTPNEPISLNAYARSLQRDFDRHSLI